MKKHWFKLLIIIWLVVLTIWVSNLSEDITKLDNNVGVAFRKVSQLINNQSSNIDENLEVIEDLDYDVDELCIRINVCLYHY